MSDKADIRIVEEAPQEEKKKKPSVKKRWLLFGAVFGLVLVLLVWFLLSSTTSLDGVKRFFRYFGKDEAQYGRLQFESYGTCSYALADGRFAVATQGGATLFAEDGSALCRVQGGFSAPALKSAGSYLLLYDIGGTRLVLLDSEGTTLFDTTASGEIYDAELTPEGYLSVLCAGTDCRATLTVYTKNGVTPYIRNVKNHYLNTCAVSPDGKYAAVSTLGQQDISFSATVQLLKTDQEELAAELSLGTQMIYDLRFLTKDRLCAVGEQRVVFFEADGTVLCEYEEENGVLTGYSFDGDGFITLVYDQYDTGGGSRLVTLNDEGKELGSIRISRSPTHLSACGGYVCILNEQELSIYDRSLTLKNKTENEGCLAAFVRSDGTALCVSSGEAVLYIP